jgi:hypothetical protein
MSVTGKRFRHTHNTFAGKFSSNTSTLLAAPASPLNYTNVYFHRCRRRRLLAAPRCPLPHCRSRSIPVLLLRFLAVQTLAVGNNVPFVGGRIFFYRYSVAPLCSASAGLHQCVARVTLHTYNGKRQHECDYSSPCGFTTCHRHLCSPSEQASVVPVRLAPRVPPAVVRRRRGPIRSAAIPRGNSGGCRGCRARCPAVLAGWCFFWAQLDTSPTRSGGSRRSSRCYVGMAHRAAITAAAA